MALKEVAVTKSGKENEGMMKLLCYYKAVFRAPENVNHYSESDFKTAEKKFLKYILLGHEPAKEES